MQLRVEQLLADENFPMPSVRFLRRAGYDVAAILEDAGGSGDTEVLDRAVAEQRILLTLDRDFGELIFRYRRQDAPTVIYFRINPPQPDDFGAYTHWLLRHPQLHWDRTFTVVERTIVRQRRLP